MTPTATDTATGLRTRPLQADAPPAGVEPRLVAEDGRHAIDPAEGHPHVGPHRLGGLQALAQDRPQPRQLLRQPPFDATRSRLAATAASRPGSFNPEASSGGRPSSVNAERTAAR